MDGIYGAIGCHPLGANLNRDRGLELARKFISHPKVVAVGEVGELLIPVLKYINLRDHIDGSQ